MKTENCDLNFRGVDFKFGGSKSPLWFQAITQRGAGWALPLLTIRKICFYDNIYSYRRILL